MVQLTKVSYYYHPMEMRTEKSEIQKEMVREGKQERGNEPEKKTKLRMQKKYLEKERETEEE